MKGLIHWFADNSVAANIMMILIMASGLMTLRGIQQEIFPEFSADLITVSVPYPGATPAEVEESLCIKIEEEVQRSEEHTSELHHTDISRMPSSA